MGIESIESSYDRLVAKNAVLEERLNTRGEEIQRLCAQISQLKKDVNPEREKGLLKSIQSQDTSIARLEKRLDEEMRQAQELRALVGEKNEFISKTMAMLGRAEAKIDVLRQALEIKERQKA
jgi:chromosome segregation ATPase